MTTLVETVRTWGRMVKFSHSIFAMPFALAGAALAAAKHGITWQQLFWIVVAMVGARNAAMGFNRLVDEDLDARNPRTAMRELPRKRLSRGSVWIFTVLLAATFVWAAVKLHIPWLAPPALVIVFGYSYTKRFTWASHWVLGLGLALAPIGGWLAVAGSLSSTPCLLAGAVLAWVAGFDIVYACQDVDFDRSAGLHSIPARFGVRGALAIARLLHLTTIVLLAAVGAAEGLYAVYWAGWGAILSVLIREHCQVRADDLSAISAGFFSMNGIVSVLYLGTVLTSLALR